MFVHFKYLSKNGDTIKMQSVWTKNLIAHY